MIQCDLNLRLNTKLDIEKMSQEWYIEQNGKKIGPVSSGRLRNLAGASEIGPKTRVRCGGEGKWIPAAEVKGLFATGKSFSAKPATPHQPKPASNAIPFEPSDSLPETSYIESEAVSRLTRFRGLLLDVFLLWLTSLGIGALIYNGWGSVAKSDVPIIVNITMVISTLLNFAYYLVFESVFRQTVGKMIVGTMIADREMLRPSFRQILLRTVCRFIPFEPVSFLFGKIGWHDSLSNTVVVRREALW